MPFCWEKIYYENSDHGIIWDANLCERVKSESTLDTLIMSGRFNLLTFESLLWHFRRLAAGMS